MINFKDKIYDELLRVTQNVSDLYPGNWEQLPAIQYTEEANNVTLKTDDAEQRVYLSYRIDIYDRGSTSLTAVAVDEVISPLGLVRTLCEDSPAPDPAGYRHKVMRYEGIYDIENDMMCWDGAR